MQRLKKRQEFLRVARAGRHAATEGVALQAFRRNPEMAGTGAPRVGFTTSKKVGNAVKRNRARRRLRAAADLVIREGGQPFFDYVLVGRTATVDTCSKSRRVTSQGEI